MPTDRHLQGVSFIDGQTGWAVGESGTIVRTTDGGASWISSASVTPIDLAERRLADWRARGARLRAQGTPRRPL